MAKKLSGKKVKSIKKALARIGELIVEYKPTALVVGYPLLLSGDRSPKCEAVDKFIERLGDFYDGPVHKVDEHYSTKEAEKIIHAHGKKIGQDKKRLDRLAAVIILPIQMFP